MNGEPGKQLVMARRAGEVWYVGGVNGQDVAIDMDVPLTFLGDGQWADRLIRDPCCDGPTDDDRHVMVPQQDVPHSTAGVMHIPKVRAHGGFVLRFTRVTSK